MSRFFHILSGWILRSREAVVLSLLMIATLPAVLFPMPNNFSTMKPGSHISIQNNKISVRASQLPLEQLMKELADQAEIEVTYMVPVNDTIGVNFDDLPLEKGLKWILRDYNNVLIYRQMKNKEPQIAKIIIFSRISKNSDSGQALAQAAPRHQSRPPAKTAVPQQVKTQAPRAEEMQGDIPESKNGALIAQVSQDLSKGKRGDVKLKAVEKLSSMNDEMTFVPLIQALYDEDINVSRNAMNALCTMKNNNVVWALKGCLADQDPKVRKLADEALKKMNAR